MAIISLFFLFLYLFDDLSRNIVNVTKVESSLVKTRETIYNHLKGLPLNVIILNESRFYHLGTIAEYTHYFCDDPVFRYETSGHHEIHVSHTSKYSRSPNTVIADSSVLMHCHKNLPSHVGPKCILEFCDIGESACIEKGCIVSNVSIPESAEVPKNVFVMTVCVKLEGTEGLFVTVGFGVEDNMKKTSCKDELCKLSYVSKPLDEVFSVLGISQDNWDLVSLWHARLFPVFKESVHSVQYTLSMLDAFREGGKITPPLEENMFGNKRLSMADILRYKDIHNTLKLREQLREKIMSYHCFK